MCAKDSYLIWNNLGLCQSLGGKFTFSFTENPAMVWFYQTKSLSPQLIQYLRIDTELEKGHKLGWNTTLSKKQATYGMTAVITDTYSKM